MKKPYKCPFCWNRYGYEHSRALHIRDDHKNILQNPSLMKASESLIEYKVGFKSFQILFSDSNFDFKKFERVGCPRDFFSKIHDLSDRA